MSEMWAEIESRVYCLGIGLSLMWASNGVNDTIRGAASALALFGFILLGSYLSRTRWSGKPVILITAEAAQAVMSGKFNVKTPEKERLH